MKFNITFTEPEEPKEPNSILTEARAKIIWGEPASSVRSFLVSNGMSDADTDAKIKEFVEERNVVIRKIGIKNILIGLLLLVASGIGFYSVTQHVPTTYYQAKGFAVIVIAAFYGLWKLINGIFRLVRPQSEEESITEIE